MGFDWEMGVESRLYFDVDAFAQIFGWLSAVILCICSLAAPFRAGVGGTEVFVLTEKHWSDLEC